MTVEWLIKCLQSKDPKAIIYIRHPDSGWPTAAQAVEIWNSKNYQSTYKELDGGVCIQDFVDFGETP